MSDDPLSFDRDPTDVHVSGTAQPYFASSAAAAQPARVSAPAATAAATYQPQSPPAPASTPSPTAVAPSVVRTSSIGTPVPTSAVAAAIEMGAPPTVRALSLKQSASQPPAHSTYVAPSQVALEVKTEAAPAAAPVAAAAAPTNGGEAAAAPAVEKKAIVDRKDFVPTNPHAAALAAIEWHNITVAEAAAKLTTNIDEKQPRMSAGLTTAEAAARLQKYGLNQLTPPPTTPDWLRYLKQYSDPLMLLLLGAALLSFIAYGVDSNHEKINLWLAIVLLTITFISSTFSFIQEGKASEVMANFKNMMAKKSKVIRDSHVAEIDTINLVPGDVVLIKSGDSSPADLRIFYTADLKVDLSSLTGESVPIQSMTGVVKKGTRLEESRNLVFNTSQCVEGEALGMVTGTGDNSLIGRIAALASDTAPSKSPLQLELEHFVYRLTALAAATGVIFFIVGMSRGRNFLDAFINCFIIIILAWVPQGLPMTVVSCLALTARTLAEKNVFVKELKSVETLGSTTVIASDKTGTLTQNKMTVVHLWYDLIAVNETQALREAVAPSGPLQNTHGLSTVSWIDVAASMVNRTAFVDQRVLTDEEAQQLEAAHVLSSMDPNLTFRSATNAYPLLNVIRNDMTLRSMKKKFATATQDDSKRAVTGGDASDTAIFNYVKKRVSPELMRHRYEAVFEVPFSSRTKYALQIVKPRPRAQSKLGALAGAAQFRFGDPHNKRTLLAKGAPEVILGRCTHYMFRGARVPIDQNFREQYQSAYETFGGQGERVLGFAMLDLDEKSYGPDKDGTYCVELPEGDEKNAGPKTLAPANGYTFLGLMALVDPPKKGVAEAVEEVRKAGVKVIMVTGDHPLTAASIARQVNIITGLTKDEIKKLHESQRLAGAGVQLVNEDELNAEEAVAVVVTGPQLEAFTERDWTQTLTKEEIVFARTTPAQKLRIVQHLQAMNHIVAVTGDGVNDSPALKKADIGVAMGSGADVAKSAGDVILMDDNFASIVIGIKEGRTIFDNLKKTTAYTVTHLVPEIIPALFNLALAFPNGLSSILLLTIDCGTEMAPAISFAYEKSEADVMDKPPRQKDERMVGRNMVIYIGVAGILQTLTCFIGFFMTFAHYGVGISDLYNSGYDFWVEDAEPITIAAGGVCTPEADGSCIYNADRQMQILREAQTAFWALLVMSQFFHVWFLKTRSIPVLDHGLFSNTTMIYGVMIEVGLMMIIAYIPFCQPFFGSADITPNNVWAIMLVGCGFMFLINEPRKYWIRKYPTGSFAKWASW